LERNLLHAWFRLALLQTLEGSARFAVCPAPNISVGISRELEISTVLVNIDESVTRPNPRRSVIRVGHRGTAGHAPENTLAAIHTGISLGVDYIEVDVQRTRDSRLIIMHDTSVNRTTNGMGMVREMTWEAMQRLDAGHGQRVPSLEAVLDAANRRVGLMLEIKAAGIATDIYGTVQAAQFSGPVIYASFLHTEIAAIRATDAKAITMALIEGVATATPTFAVAVNATMVGMDIESATGENVAALHKAGLQVFAYTANEPQQIELALNLGVNGIISDYPDRIPRPLP
jgi:glycerophosphoryl diester phosphodiesterase